VDDPKTSRARLNLAKGFFETVRLHDTSSEHEIRNALSRCYYSFFHGCHVVLGRYWRHKEVAEQIGVEDEPLGHFVERLRRLRSEAD
jgi:hypothetical protein